MAPASRSPQPLAACLLAASLLLLAAGMSAGSEGWSLDWRGDAELIGAIRAPRSLGAWAAGALLGIAGALSQGLFRNPLADPFLLGSASGAGLGVVLVLAAGGSAGATLGLAQAGWLLQAGLVGAAFVGALVGVLLTLMLAGGAARPMRMLLCGVVVGVLMGALSDLLLILAPEALRGKQVFLLGTTGFLGWQHLAWMGASLAVLVPLARRWARVLDALVLGEASAASLGLNLPRWRLGLVSLMALATACAVSQAGLVAFVGLVAPHIVRRWVVVTHAGLVTLSALSGGVLLLAADVLSRSVIAPQELPVGVVTALLGGGYLLWLLRQQGRAA